jgi:hypothetical protein
MLSGVRGYSASHRIEQQSHVRDVQGTYENSEVAIKRIRIAGGNARQTYRVFFPVDSIIAIGTQHDLYIRPFVERLSYGVNLSIPT